MRSGQPGQSSWYSGVVGEEPQGTELVVVGRAGADLTEQVAHRVDLPSGVDIAELGPALAG